MLMFEHRCKPSSRSCLRRQGKGVQRSGARLTRSTRKGFPLLITHITICDAAVRVPQNCLPSRRAAHSQWRHFGAAVFSTKLIRCDGGEDQGAEESSVMHMGYTPRVRYGSRLPSLTAPFSMLYLKML